MVFAGLAAVYLGLAILFTRPLIAHAMDCTPKGSGSGDQCQTIWFFWWTKTALFNLHQSPFWTDLIYYPYGTGLGYHISPLTNLLAIVVSALSGTPVNSPLVYNVLVLVSFVVTGLGTFALIRHAVGNTLAAFLGSLFVTFSPYSLFHLDHLNLISIGWGISSIYFAIRYLDTQRRAHLIWAVVFFVVQFYMSLTNAMLVVCFVFFYLLLSVREVFSSPQRGRLVLWGIGGVLFAALLAMPLLLSLRNCDSRWLLSWRDSIPNSTSLLDFVAPTHRPSQTGPGEAYIGWLIIAPAVAALLYTRRKLRHKWAAMGGIFLVLSLGPALVIGGRQVFDGWMPYRWLYSLVPYFNLSRTPARFVILAQLCLSVLASCGIAAVADQVGRVRKRAFRQILRGAGTTLVIAAIYLSYVRGPILLSPMHIPPVYQEVAADPEIKAILNLPIAEKQQICNWYMYWQTTHGRKEVNGYLTHHSVTATPLLDSIKTWQEFGPEQKARLIAAGVDAVVLHHPQQESELIRLK